MRNLAEPATKAATGTSNESEGKPTPKDAKAMLVIVSHGLFSFKESAQSDQWNDPFSRLLPLLR